MVNNDNFLEVYKKDLIFAEFYRLEAGHPFLKEIFMYTFNLSEFEFLKYLNEWGKA